MNDMTVQKHVAYATGEVGIFGVFAVLHDQFDPARNLSHYETWPLIQSAIRKLDAELTASLAIYGNPIDEEVDSDYGKLKFEEHGITPLSERKTVADS